jgi:hypothetical protein
MSSRALVPPFFANTDDDMHCTEACMASILTYFGHSKPNRVEDLDDFTGHQRGKPTWNYRSYLSLAQIGLQVRVYSLFNPEEFAKRPEVYLAEAHGPAAAAMVMATSDAIGASRTAKATLNHPNIHYHVSAPSLATLTEELNAGAVCMCWVDHGTLLETGEFEGHAVIATQVTATHVMVNDPGSPARENWPVPHSLFQKAWGGIYPAARSLCAVINLP